MSIFQEEGKTRGKDTFQVLCLVLSGKQDVFRILHREVLFKKYLFGQSQYFTYSLPCSSAEEGHRW